MKAIALILIGLALLCAHVSYSRTIVPYPSTYVKGGSYNLTVVSNNFKVTVNGAGGSVILSKGIDRYKKLIFFEPSGNKIWGLAEITMLNITVSDNSEILQQGIDESYVLIVDSPVATLKAVTVYGALRGLETLSQLIDYDTTEGGYIVYDAPHNVQDTPRFPYRGILVDVARHFEEVSTLKTILDGMSFAKLNVLHLHATDDQAFPFPSKTFPRLTKGAYDPSLTYSEDDLNDLVEYAKERGIRVVPEFDTPAHALSWGVGYPEFLTANCSWFTQSSDTVNPIQDFTYQLLKGFFTDMTEFFFDDVLHVGLDEVDFSCWSSNPAIVSWAQQKNLTMAGVENYYVSNLNQILLGLKKRISCWEECYDNGLTLPANTIVEVWRDWGSCWGPCKVANVTASGFHTLNSAGWYLDDLTISWQSMYILEPFQYIMNNPAQQALVDGGETCMWGESVNDEVIISRVFPRATAVAERLWSPIQTTNTTDFELRLYEFSCRNTRRGVSFGPWRPAYCLPNGYGSLSPEP
eukprot:TRINITY_DN3960_c0_g1_i1.p1 TRINITY_DN3960_c0_g1~~TRINITY_DN3960_c0_g1_i1.p1  ORF type:complete len:556 (-),score=112.88 TRINITY_DN3960_c0_g1_i1:166-1731(-)